MPPPPSEPPACQRKRCQPRQPCRLSAIDDRRVDVIIGGARHVEPIVGRVERQGVGFSPRAARVDALTLNGLPAVGSIHGRNVAAASMAHIGAIELGVDGQPERAIAAGRLGRLNSVERAVDDEQLILCVADGEDAIGRRIHLDKGRLVAYTGPPRSLPSSCHRTSAHCHRRSSPRTPDRCSD